jgi:hypothetical protein
MFLRGIYIYIFNESTLKMLQAHVSMGDLILKYKDSEQFTPIILYANTTVIVLDVAYEVLE